ncbi:ubiquinol-cytochrome c reductase cytochrome b subunit [Streptomyces sp. BR123]|uniref:cytochrome bc1 complex cytochrome b subunit n=1 Tax=Streptomyces sp. BR123 TaxID=2749828 RepID=UPI0015C45FE0|nr:ubiquinol-cytochrome c reductase cytochrome b subunit [Streptomyces sp. BR123]NXY93333.1 ubiquinol-cytochrome c reductase cytochrome b subunit [Streptomyces sp. BR123]
MPASTRTTGRKARAGSPAVRGAEWLDARLPLAELTRSVLRKVFPDHWSFLLGEIALYSLVVLLLTGVYLTFFFDPSMAEEVYRGSYEPLQGVPMSRAFDSTLTISFDVRGGLLVRQVHHWAAIVFVAAIGVHMLRVFLTGAFRRPRELNWTIGVTLFLLALLEGFAGYSLPDDLLSGTGLRIAQGIMLSVPVVGTYLSMLVFGGQFPGEDIVPRLYALHVLLVPGLLVALVTVHVLLVFVLKHTQWPGRGRTARNAVGLSFFPNYVAKSGGLFLAVAGVLAVLGGAAQVNPIWVYGPYRPDLVSTGSQPDWYIGFLEGALRLMPGVETRLWGHTVNWNPLLTAVVLPGLLFAVLYAYPFFERWITPGPGERHLCDRPRDRPVRTGLAVGALSCYAVLLVAGGQDIAAFVFDVPVVRVTWALRVAFFAAPVIAFWTTRRLCLALQAREAAELAGGAESGLVVQGVEGGFRPRHRPLSADERRGILVRERPQPLPSAGPQPAAGAGRLRGPARRVRSALSAWYYADRVPYPVTAGQRRAVEDVLAGPDRRPPADGG